MERVEYNMWLPQAFEPHYKHRRVNIDGHDLHMWDNRNSWIGALRYTAKTQEGFVFPPLRKYRRKRKASSDL